MTFIISHVTQLCHYQLFFLDSVNNTETLVGGTNGAITFKAIGKRLALFIEVFFAVQQTVINIALDTLVCSRG